MKNKIILHLCADIGSDSISYKENSYDVRLIGSDIGVENYHPPNNVYGIIANPPCTHFSIARTTAKTSRDLKEGMRLVKECLRIIWECQYNIGETQRKSNLQFWSIENPATGFLKWFLGKPVFEYRQWEYGADMVKKTALWGMFNIPEVPIWMDIPKIGSTSNKGWAKKRTKGGRSICPIGFAKAFYEANK
jgi:hypothetical protein